MLTDEDPTPTRPRFQPLPLDRLGVDELHAYTAELRAEITRADAEIARKRDLMSAAEGVFGPRKS